ncbi:amidohydrolase family protein [Georgenia halophila]|uniref:Amidohydrolase family protein n=1 Tax=Georgenia halophila TaxID=620889 RepID=A0ABP8L054_9MICO
MRGRVVTKDSVIDDGVVVVDGEKLAWVGPASHAAAAGWGGALSEMPTHDGYVLPGLVDLHNHGGGGTSFPDATTPEDVLRGVAEHRRHGTTSVVVSLVTAAPDDLRDRVTLLADIADSGEIAGIHIEGPFLSAARCGAQNPELIIAPDARLTEELLRLGRGHVVTMTLAPEGDGVQDVAAALVAGGALPSWGHTDSDPDSTRSAVAASADNLAAGTGRSARATVTHLFNGMRPLHHRDPGPIGELLAAAARGQVVVELIGDGTHLHPAIVREVHGMVGRDSAVLVTDAMAATGMADGDYELGSRTVTVADGVARLNPGGSIAGGTAHLLDIVRTSVDAGVPLVDAVYMASTGPAAVLGDPGIGALEAGRRADVVITDDGLHPVRVIRQGREIT